MIVFANVFGVRDVVCRSIVSIGLVSAIAFVGFGVAPAVAQEGSHADDTAAFLASVRPFPEYNAPLAPRGGSSLATEAGDVAIPATSDGSVQLTSGVRETLSVRLPGEGTNATVAADRTVVYGDEDGMTLAVQGGQGEVRIHAVFDSRSGLRRLDYRFPGLEAELNADGSISLFAEAVGMQISAGFIDAPWAADARGNPVETHYRVDGDMVTQDIVVDDDVEFPVAADPRFQADCGIVTCTIRFDRQTTKSWSDYGGNVGAMVGALATAGAVIGGPVGAAIGASAGVIIGARAAIFSGQARDFYANGNCFGIKYSAAAPAVSWGTQVKRNTFNCR